MIASKQCHDLLGFGAIRESGKATQVQENGSDLTPVAFEQVIVVALKNGLGYLGGEITLKTVQAFKQIHLLTDLIHQGPIPFL